MTLTHKQITEAFPDEVRTEVPRLLKLNRSKMMRLQNYLSGLYSNSQYTAWEKKFFSILCYHTVGERIEGHIKRLKRYRYFIRPPATGVPVREELNVEAARDIPIESLHNFGKMKNGSNRIHTLCPLHNDKNPSFVIYKKTNSYHCFTCQKGGDNINFVMELNGCSFVEAVRFILCVPCK